MSEWQDGVTEWPSDRVSECPSDQVTKWSSDQVTKWPSDRVTKLTNDWIIKWPNDWVTGWKEASQTIDRMVYFINSIIVSLWLNLKKIIIQNSFYQSSQSWSIIGLIGKETHLVYHPARRPGPLIPPVPDGLLLRDVCAEGRGLPRHEHAHIAQLHALPRVAALVSLATDAFHLCIRE